MSLKIHNLAIITLVFLCFWPCLDHDFVNWDDAANFVENPHYRGLSLSHLEWMFTTFHLGHYQPLTWMTLSVDYMLWGMNPKGYHLTNLILHSGNSLLFFLLAITMMRIIVGQVASAKLLYASAMVGAFFFAIHPLRVESVAWVTERRDLVAGLFFLLSLWAYARMSQAYEHQRARWWWTLAFLFFILSLFAKAWAITLPILLLVLDVYPLRRFPAHRRQILLEKIPYVVVAVVMAIVAALAQQDTGATRALGTHTLPERFMQAMYGLCFYVGKTVFPYPLAPIYELEQKLNPLEAKYLFCAVVVFAIFGVLLWQYRRWPGLLCAWLCYTIIVSPVLGFFQSGPQIAADRYTYLACMPWAIGVSVGMYRVLVANRIRPVMQYTCVGALLLFLVFLSFLTLRQTQIWKNSLTLWSHAVQVSPQSHIALLSLGALREQQENWEEAAYYYEEVIRQYPTCVDAHFNLAELYEKRGFAAMAIQKYQHVLKLDPQDAQAHNNLANLYSDGGENDKAIIHYKKAIAIGADILPYYNLGLTYLQKGWTDKAVAVFYHGLAVKNTFQRDLRFSSLPNAAALYTKIKLAIVERLGKMPPRHDIVTMALEKAADDENPKVRMRAAQVLQKYRSK